LLAYGPSRVRPEYRASPDAEPEAAQNGTPKLTVKFRLMCEGSTHQGGDPLAARQRGEVQPRSRSRRDHGRQLRPNPVPFTPAWKTVIEFLEKYLKAAPAAGK
jgi:hypothetical protein